MEKTRNILVSSLEDLKKKQSKKFKDKLLVREQSPAVTRREVEETGEDDGDLADLLIQTFEDDAVNVAAEIMKSIGCKATASKLLKDYEESLQTQSASVGENASDGPSCGTQSSRGDEGTSSQLSLSKTTPDELDSGDAYAYRGTLCQQTQRPSVEKKANDSPSYGKQSSKGIEIKQISDPTLVYTMNSKPRGTCVIFNNVNFVDKSKRKGSDQDADALKQRFQWLGFHPVNILKDKTMQEMEKHLEDLSKSVTGDCFVCCVLSHGNERGVHGSDDKILSLRDILSPFSGGRCPALAGKPKVFFIQACRGLAMQDKVKIQADGDNSLDGIISIPIYADFLIAMSTFEGFVSLRDPEQGTWFIQSLCRQLADSCPKGEDILSILTKVNKDVSAMEASFFENKAKRIRQELAKQSPESRFTLRKKLVFHVAE